jgi:hypothetical protein
MNREPRDHFFQILPYREACWSLTALQFPFLPHSLSSPPSSSQSPVALYPSLLPQVLHLAGDFSQRSDPHREKMCVFPPAVPQRELELLY